MPFDSANWLQPVEVVDETTALLPPQAASDATTRLLIRARGLLERGLLERGWCKNEFARDSAGLGVKPTDARAIEWCVNGALIALGVPWQNGAYGQHPAVVRLKNAIGGRRSIGEFNNDQETVEPVLAAFDRAIAMGREG
jgi:hypothetical protein